MAPIGYTWDMHTPRLAVVGLLVALSLVLVPACKAEFDASSATGAISKTGKSTKGKLWKAMAKRQKTWLKNWRSAFAQGDPSDRDVIDAWGEIAYAATGPAGFWRNKVPNLWMGCARDGNTPSCAALRNSEKEFARWDKFQEKMENLKDGQEGRFLKKHGKKMLSYLSTYVPTKPSASGMKATGFYNKSLKVAMEKGGPTMGGADNDL